MEKRFPLAALILAAILISAGCGTKQDCHLLGLTVSPTSATADHSVAAPGDEIQFVAGPVVPTGCAVAACVNCWGQTWTVSDPVNVSIVNDNPNNGLATCQGATNGGITVTASAPAGGKSTQTVSASATLICK